MSMAAKSSIVKIAKLRFDTETPFDLGKEVEWTQALIDELQEELDEEDKSNPLAPIFVTFNGFINKRKSDKYEEVVILSGKLKAQFSTYCVSTGELMTDVVEADVNAASIEENNQQKYGLDEEVIDIELDGVEFDLFYYKENELDLLPILHEYLFLNKNPYPRINTVAEEEE